MTTLPYRSTHRPGLFPHWANHPDQKHQNSASAVSFSHHNKDGSTFPKHPYIQQGRWTNSSWLYVCGIWQLNCVSGSVFDAVASVSLRLELYVWSLCTATMQTSCCNHCVSATQRWVLWKHLFCITICVCVLVCGCLGLGNRMHGKNKGGLHSSVLYIQGEDKIKETNKNIIKDLINTSRTALIPLGMLSWTVRGGFSGYRLKSKSSVSLMDDGDRNLMYRLCSRITDQWCLNPVTGEVMEAFHPGVRQTTLDLF